MAFSKLRIVPAKRRLIVDCHEAPDAAADLRSPECRRGVLAGIDREVRIESIVLSHYRERQYGKASVDVLLGILDLVKVLERLSTRAPSPVFPGVSRRDVAARCAACPFNPRRMFVQLREDLLDDFARLHEALVVLAHQLHAYREPGCGDCTDATREDLIFLFRRAAAFGDSVIGSAAGAGGPG